MKKQNKELTVCFYPSNKKRTNHFLYNLSNLLESTGKIRCVGYKDISKKSLYSYNVYHINWFDQSKNFVSFLKRLYFLLALKLKGKRIVWTIHNIVSHEKTPFYNRLLFKTLVIASDAIHVMCQDTISIARLEHVRQKVHFVPHGDYYGSYPESDYDVHRHYGIEKSRKIFLFMEAIMTYKNIEVLIRAFKSAFEYSEKMEKNDHSPILLICGKVEPESYKDVIENLIGEDERIHFSPGFVSDECLAAYIQSSSMLVVPYSYRSSLNSGTIPLAFTFGKTVICPDIACVKDVVVQADCLYSYHYESEEDHVQKLSQKMMEAIDDALHLDNGKLLARERNARDYMAKNSWIGHKKEWLELFGFDGD